MGFSSWSHWLIVLLIIVLLFGAKKIPELAKGLGSGIKNFKKAIKEDEEETTLNATESQQDKIQKDSTTKETTTTPNETTKV
ncbi:twin-arginine translocase TatA/TatE family subunit [Helicobacter pullorum]|uniref:Sec-independent protein translocase protein TatA n=1 Tax=Helicobacter pullorum TaxID=35818 RepID=A0A0N1ECR6_9HELI|nr:twin-arginine translocase TatA/TatE family subunit [Helicobacter pullorum]HIS08348.1 twin-arginine translocase TatA/TatE family subunit [Candidatus Scatomorpha intestinipullorum]KAB0575181.1 twin-arginine translocase TatA/TatE family subunit [Helicobacter pullorum NCTC 12824]KPH50406.1 preprotein translocase subunit TatA [Helicobacter pullorum]KPH52515.1 preprotein translocase subunit TatA [Helicobacter pullorum]KPH55572.1 preprotein translocase subunit TatA [Helicobacter pullorum]